MAVLVLLAYLIPEWAAWWRSDVFVFVNGWDEETYLSWQGVLGARNDPGYFVLHLYGWLHQLGIPGAVQNLLSDTAFPIASAVLVTATLRHFGIEARRAIAYAVLILFSSTLFNYANPVVKALLGSYDGSAFMMAGWELYPSILRTPNPQVSYFLIALATYAWARWRRDWLLLLPLPLLYYFVAVPYCAILLMVAVLRWYWNRFERVVGVPALVVVAISVWLVMATGAAILFSLMGYMEPDHWFRQDPWLFIPTYKPQMPLALVGFSLIYLTLVFYKTINYSHRLHNAFWLLVLAALATVNLHIVTGFMLAQKNYYDYGLSIVFGLLLVSVIECVSNRKLADFMLGTLLVATLIPTLASHIYFHKRAVAISARAAVIEPAVLDDPLHALIVDREVSSRMAYANARMLAPPFSYQYYFPFIERQCSLYPTLLDAAMNEAQTAYSPQSVQRAMLDETLANIHGGQARAIKLPYRDHTYCTSNAYMPRSFRLFDTVP